MKDPLNNNLNDNWINNPKLADIDKTKLEMLSGKYKRRR